MAVSHMDRLSATDAAFLVRESERAHMHIGGVCIFEGPPPAYDEFLEHIEARLHLVPRFRQKLAFPPLQTGRPLWVDDSHFNAEYHVRHSSLPAPGGDRELALLVGRIFSQRLDPSKPLWEIWLVQGLEGNRFGLMATGESGNKGNETHKNGGTHHAAPVAGVRMGERNVPYCKSCHQRVNQPAHPLKLSDRPAGRCRYANSCYFDS